VVHDLAGQLGGGERGITGVMLESFLVEGRQNLVDGANLGSLTYGQSITDACLGWEATAEVLEELAQAVRARG
jgi:3-deoxy-7-phosphoheptulonate synthase